MIPKCDCMLPCAECNTEREQEMLKISEEMLSLRDRIQELEDEKQTATSAFMMSLDEMRRDRDAHQETANSTSERLAKTMGCSSVAMQECGEAERKVKALKTQLSEQIDITILRVKERDAAHNQINVLNKSLKLMLNVVEILGKKR